MGREDADKILRNLKAINKKNPDPVWEQLIKFLEISKEIEDWTPIAVKLSDLVDSLK